MLRDLSEGFCPHHNVKLVPNRMDAGECPKGCEWALVGEPMEVIVGQLHVRPNGEPEWQTRVDQPPIVFYIHPAEWPCFPRGDGSTLDWPYAE